MTEEILVNHTAQETRVAVVQQGAAAGTAHRARRQPRPGRQHLPRRGGARAARHAVGVHRHRPRARRLPARRRHLGVAQRPGNGGGTAADREAAVRGPAAAGAGDQGSDRHQGRAAVDADQHRRPAAGLPAAGPAHRHLAAHRGRDRARSAARPGCRSCCRPTRRAASSSAPWPKTRSTPSSRPTSSTCASAGGRSSTAAAASPRPPLLYQDLSLGQRVLRDIASDATAAILVDSPETLADCPGSPAPTRRRWRAGCASTTASGRCSTCTASRTKSRRRCRAAST